MKNEFDVEVKVRMRFVVDPSFSINAMANFGAGISSKKKYNEWIESPRGALFQDAVIAALLANPELLKRMVSSIAISDAHQYLGTEIARNDLLNNDVCSALVPSLSEEHANTMRDLLGIGTGKGSAVDNFTAFIVAETNLDTNIPVLFEQHKIGGDDVNGIIMTGKSSVSVSIAERCSEIPNNVVALR